MHTFTKSPSLDYTPSRLSELPGFPGPPARGVFDSTDAYDSDTKEMDSSWQEESVV